VIHLVAPVWVGTKWVRGRRRNITSGSNVTLYLGYQHVDEFESKCFCQICSYVGLLNCWCVAVAMDRFTQITFFQVVKCHSIMSVVTWNVTVL